MRVCLMIEGQEDVSWEQWLALAHACEENGIEALFRSDHYLSVDDRRERASLDAWATICALGAVTEKVRLGTLVSPVTFRHPSLLAKTVVTADHVSGGRVELGLGTGWLQPEHDVYGFQFPPLGERMELLAEQLEIVRGAWGEGPFSFDGHHYRVRELDALPKPVQRPGPPLIVGGGARPRSAALAARFADEYNTFYATVDECRSRRSALDEACKRAGRDPESLPLSLMTGCLLGRDRSELDSRARLLAERHHEPSGGAGAFPDTWIAGTVEQAAERLRAFEGVGVERVMLQHLLHDDLEMVALIGRELAAS